MSDRPTLTVELAKQVTRLEDDLRSRADAVPEVTAIVEAEWQRAHAAGRTAHDLPTWRESLLTQVAVGWVLGTTFLRFCEDTGLLPDPVITGPGDRARRAEDAQRAWFREHPADGERGYLTEVFRLAATLPGLTHVFEPHNPVWQFGPSDDGVRGLLTYWREVVPETGILRRNFTRPDRSTRFLGDLYQDLSESARKQYALLQTPEFVEEFILKHTLDPAIEEFRLDGFRMIDPACGSGHFLLGSFDRLLECWRRRAPQEGDRALAERALTSIHGVDLNPFAAAIARFRLLVAALQAAGIRTLAEAPRFTIKIAVGDALLHGPPPGQQVLGDIESSDPATRHLFATEDAETIHQFLSGGYHAVVANPPYITPKDPAANKVYRRRYSEVCHRQYALTVPFMQRLFDLAIPGSHGTPAGFVGQITANSFMKREFGKPLIEKFLTRKVSLTHVIDTSGAYLPGMGTPTVILFGRNSQPFGDTLRAVLGTRGEPSRPTDPAKGEVWTSITDLVDRPGSENEYMSVVDLARDRLAKHPWSMGGGGASSLKAVVEGSAQLQLQTVARLIGYYGQTNADEVMLAPQRSFSRQRVESDVVTLMAVGDLFRDWNFTEDDSTLFPYDCGGLVALERVPYAHRWLWPCRTPLGERRTFAKTSYFDEGRPWWEWHQIALERLRTPLSIAFAFVATHNHFVLDRGGKVFNRSAPVIKLPAGAGKDEHLALVGLLNSAVACFWMKQVFHGKGNRGGERSTGRTEWEEFFEFDGTKLKQFPIPSGSVLGWARRLDDSARELSDNLPSAAVGRTIPTRAALDAARTRVDWVRADVVATQEELDWRCLHLYGVTPDDLSLPPGEAPPIERGQRAFEVVLARRMAESEPDETWFERHGSTPITELPTGWPADYRSLVERRIELIESDRFVGLAERPEYKRRWAWAAWEDLEREALRTWLLDRLEESRYWPDTVPRSAAQLADAAGGDADFVQVAELYAGTVDVDLTTLISALVKDEAVPYLAAWRYTEPGLRTRAAWERTWDLQRREDAGEDVGTIPVPPKYGQGDFADKASWKLRGKLDVPKERFVAYPGLGRPADPTPLVGWAGWDHLQCAQALATTYEQRRSVDGWTSEQLRPILAGLAELVPWLRQWHNDIDSATGLRLGDFFAEFVATESAANGFGTDDLAAWKPPARTAGRRKRRAAGAT